MLIIVFEYIWNISFITWWVLLHIFLLIHHQLKSYFLNYLEKYFRLEFIEEKKKAFVVNSKKPSSEKLSNVSEGFSGYLKAPAWSDLQQSIFIGKYVIYE